MGDHRAAVGFQPRGQAKQRLRFWGAPEVIGPLSTVDLIQVAVESNHTRSHLFIETRPENFAVSDSRVG